MKEQHQGDLRQRIGPQQSSGFQPQTRRSEQWTVDPFWEMDRPTPVQQQQHDQSQYDEPGPSSATANTEHQFAQIPMEEGEIESETDQDPSILEVPAWNWARYVGVKSVQYVKMGHAPKVAALDENAWDLEQAVRETEKNFSTDLQLLMTETTNDPTLLKTLVSLERQQHELIPEEYQMHKRKLSSRFGLVFIEDKIIVPKNLRATIISLLHKGHPAINKMSLAARHFWWPRMTEAIQKKCETCLPCKMSGKNIKPNIPSTEINSLPPLDNPNEEIQLDFIGPMTENNRRFYILLSMDRYSKWPAASFCTSTDGETAVKFLDQYIRLNGIPKIIRIDKATAFTGRLFRDFCKKHYIKLIYGTPYIHTPTGLVERGVRTLKENLLTNIKAGERFGKALDISLDVMRKTPHTRLKKSAFELHYGRKPNTEISNLLNLDEIEKLTKRSVSAKPDTLQVYSFSGAGGVSDQLPMKPKKNSKGVSCPFFFLEKKHQRNKLESAYSDKPQLAISGTNHTVTTPNGRVIHRKMISKPIDFNQENTNRGIGPRGPDGRFVKSPSKHQRAMIIDSDTESETLPMEIDSPKTPELSTDTTIKKGTLGRGRPKLIRDRASPNTTNTPTPGNNIGPLTITTSNMTDTEINRAIEDANSAEQEIFIRDENGKVLTDNSTKLLAENLENSELELASNLSSSTEIETEEKEPVRRSKRLTKTNPIIRYNNPICHDYRKHRKQTEFGSHTGSTKSQTEGGEQQPVNRSQNKILTLRPNNNRDKQNSQERSTVHHKLDQWRNNNRHIRKQESPLAEISANSRRRGNVEDRRTLTNFRN